MKNFGLLPENSLEKLNKVLDGILARPQEPSTPQTIKLDQLTQELDHLRQSNADPAFIAKKYEDWKRLYTEWLGTKNVYNNSSVPSSNDEFQSQTTDDEEIEDWLTSRKLSTFKRPSFKDQADEIESTESDSEYSTISEPTKQTKSHICPKCGKGFGNRSWLTKHLKTSHQLWQGMKSTPPGVTRFRKKANKKVKKKTMPKPEKEMKTGKGIIFYPAASRR